MHTSSSIVYIIALFVCARVRVRLKEELYECLYGYVVAAVGRIRTVGTYYVCTRGVCTSAVVAGAPTKRQRKASLDERVVLLTILYLTEHLGQTPL